MKMMRRLSAIALAAVVAISSASVAFAAFIDMGNFNPKSESDLRQTLNIPGVTMKTITISEGFELSEPLVLPEGFKTTFVGGSLLASDDFSGDSMVIVQGDDSKIIFDCDVQAGDGRTAVEVENGATIVLENGKSIQGNVALGDGTKMENNGEVNGNVSGSDSAEISGGIVNGELIGPQNNNTTVNPPVVPDTPDEDKPSRDNDDSDYYGVEKWNEVKRQIADADEGDTIQVSATGLPHFPSSVARELKGKDITLEIRKNGVTYKVNGLEIGAVDKIWYEFENIEEQLLTAEPEDKADEKPQDGDTVKENPATGR